jgi:hypothetical protein
MPDKDVSVADRTEIRMNLKVGKVQDKVEEACTRESLRVIPTDTKGYVLQ